MLQALCCCQPHLFCIDLDMTYFYTNLKTTSYILALALFGKGVLCILQSQGQEACLMAGSQEKTTYRLALFPFGSSKAKNTL